MLHGFGKDQQFLRHLLRVLDVQTMPNANVLLSVSSMGFEQLWSLE